MGMSIERKAWHRSPGMARWCGPGGGLSVEPSGITLNRNSDVGPRAAAKKQSASKRTRYIEAELGGLGSGQMAKFVGPDPGVSHY